MSAPTSFSLSFPPSPFPFYSPSLSIPQPPLFVTYDMVDYWHAHAY